MGKLGSVIKKEANPMTHVRRSKNILGGKPGEQGGFLTPEIQAQNAQAAKTGYELALQTQEAQRYQLGALDRQIRAQEAQNAGVSPEQQAQDVVAADIENRRRALDVANRGSQQTLARGLARRGLGQSAAGLFAESQQNQAMQDQIAGLEGGRASAQFNLANELQNQRINRQQALLGQQNQILAGVDRPYIQTTTEGTPGTKGLLGVAGGVVGGIYGGPAGAAAGYQAGDTLGGFIRGGPRKRFG